MAYTKKKIQDFAVTSPLTGFVAALPSDVVGADSIQQAIEKVQGQINAKSSATNAELNTGTDNAKIATALALEGSKYITQNGTKLFAIASGTNTYTATLTPNVTAIPKIIYIKFTNGNTGIATLNLNGLGDIAIVKNVSSVLELGDISSGRIMILIFDGTKFQIANLTLPSAPNKVITTNGSGDAVSTYDLIDQFTGTTSIATLDAANWTSGSVTATGAAGEKRFGSEYEYTCTGTNVWRRTPYNLIVNDFIIGTVADGGGIKTSAQMVVLFPSAVPPQIAIGTTGIYQYVGLLGWFYFAKTS